MTFHYHDTSITMGVYTNIQRLFLASLAGITSGVVLTYMLYDVKIQTMKRQHTLDITELKKKYGK